MLGRPGSDRLSRVLRRSTIGAERFHGRVRDGIGCVSLARATRSSKHMAPTLLLTGGAFYFVTKRNVVLMKIDKRK